MYSLVAEITMTSKEMAEKLEDWATENLSEEMEQHLESLDDADSNWMGLIPALFDADMKTLPEDLADRAFCDGGSLDDDADPIVVKLYFRAPDWCDDLWEYLGKQHPEFRKVRVYVDPDYEDDIEELGEDDLLVYENT